MPIRTLNKKPSSQQEHLQGSATCRAAAFSRSLVVSLSLAALLVLSGAAVQSQDDDDFIILDDRGEQEPSAPQSGETASPQESGRSTEDDDIPMSGTPAPKPTARAGAGAESGPAPPPPRRFEPSEKVSEDLSVSFPADI